MKVGILVVTYNRLELLKEVVSSLRSQTYKERDIIVVNNGSSDGSEEWLLQQSDIHVITQGNVGGAGGFNTGLRYVAESGYDACWLMDDDVVCQPDALEQLIEAFEAEPNLGYVCSKVVGLDGVPMNVPMVDQRTRDGRYQDWMKYIDRQMIKIESSTFVSLFVPTSVVKKVGLPYKQYFIWGDDAEYTMRITRKYDAYLAGKSVVTHKRTIQGDLLFENETNKQRLKNFFYYFRNQTHIVAKYKGTIKTIGNVFSLTCLFFKLFFTGRFAKSMIVLKSQFAWLFFCPKIEYIDNNK